MDKNTITGIMLIMGMLLTYNTFFAPKDPVATDTKPKVEKSTTKAVVTQSIADTSLQKAKLGVFYQASLGNSQMVCLENKDVKVILNTKGGAIEKVLLKNYTTYQNFVKNTKEPLVIFDKSFDKISLEIPTQSGNIDIQQLYYTTTAKNSFVNTESPQNVIFSSEIAPGKKVEQIYTLGKEGFSLGYQLKMNGLENILKNEDYKLNWEEKVRNTEKDIQESRKATVNYVYEEAEEFDQLPEVPTSVEQENLEKPVEWVSFKKKYFLSSFITKNAPIQKAFISATPNLDDTLNIKTLIANVNLPMSDLKTGKANFEYYFGPNDYSKIKNIAPAFGKNVKLSYDILLPITRYVFVPLFGALEKIFSNYGLLIIVLVLIIKLAMSPLTYKSYVSMAKMRILQPEIAKIKERVGDDAAKQQQEQMKLYSEVGVSPLSGCVPVLATMPILMAVFFLFPNIINLRQQSFLWANDLSTYDSILKLPFKIPFYGDHVSLFCLLMTASQLLYGYYNNQMTPDQPGQPINMKMMAYITPIIFMFVMNSFPAGLSFYYFVSNLATIAQQLIIRKFVDEDKLKVALEANRTKIAAGGGAKKSRFSEYISKQMKAAEEAQKAQQNTKKKK